MSGENRCQRSAEDFALLEEKVKKLDAQGVPGTAIRERLGISSDYLAKIRRKAGTARPRGRDYMASGLP